MNATSLDVRTGTASAILSSRRPTPASVWLPYLALLATAAAFSWGAPAKLAALLKRAPAPQAVSFVNYPVPLHASLLARR